MIKINIDSTEFQEIQVPFEESFITIVLNFRFNNWLMNVSYLDKELNGVRLSCGSLLLDGKNLPFEIVIDDKQSGLDPFSADSFERGLFEFLIIERDELENIRGFEVE